MTLVFKMCIFMNYMIYYNMRISKFKKIFAKDYILIW